MIPPNKTISYRGGIVSLEVPAHWKEEYEPKGGGTFYEDRPDSGTLRLHVLTFSSKDGGRSEDTIRTLASKDAYETLACGLPVKRYVKKTEESGEALHLYRWEVLVPVPPIEWHVVCFTHTIVAGQENDARIAEELKIVDSLVRSARYSTLPGVPGEHFHERKPA